MPNSKNNTQYQSWGRRYIRSRNAELSAEQASPPTKAIQEKTYLPFGNGRSYGDSCHNDEGILIDQRPRSKVLSFDPATGIFKAESGILLTEIIEHVLPHGWFLAVSPGTQFVTLGGAIANDIHGKNHHRKGTFGCQTRSFELVLSSSKRHICSPRKNTKLFSATIGGLGLTGTINWAEIQLMKVASADIEQQAIKLNSLSDYFDRIEDADRENEYSVAWIDSLASGAKLGRGHLLNGNHADNGNFEYRVSKPKLSVPFTPPVPLVSGLALKAFNTLYNAKVRKPVVQSRVNYASYFYPLDGVGAWNRLYGPHGLFQHQSVVPQDNAENVIRQMIEMSQGAGQGSFLTVLKRFGDVPSPGLLSFPRPGFTLTLDFPNRGIKTLNLLQKLDALVMEQGGAINPYKDARMSAATFTASFPNWKDLQAFKDPAITSDFWKRVTL